MELFCGYGAVIEIPKNRRDAARLGFELAVLLQSEGREREGKHQSENKNNEDKF